MKPISSLFKELRLSKRLTLYQVSEYVSISEFELKQVENMYRRFTPYDLLKLADLFEYTFAELAISNETIDYYEDAEKVRWVFEQFELDSSSYIHISFVDEFTEETIKDMKQSFEEEQQWIRLIEEVGEEAAYQKYLESNNEVSSCISES